MKYGTREETKVAVMTAASMVAEDMRNCDAEIAASWTPSGEVIVIGIGETAHLLQIAINASGLAFIETPPDDWKAPA